MIVQKALSTRDQVWPPYIVSQLGAVIIVYLVGPTKQFMTVPSKTELMTPSI